VKYIFAVLGGVVVLASPGHAQGSWTWMTDTEITTAFEGVTIKGEYSDLAPFTETYKKDGEADYYDARGQVSGQWSVVNNHFCTLYETMNGGCFRAVQRGNNCYEFYSSTSTPAETENPPDKGAWIARAWAQDQPSTCMAETV
jgi:hypothetical protein